MAVRPAKWQHLPAGADFLVRQHIGERFPNWDFCFPLMLEISSSAKRVKEHVRVVNVGNALFAQLETLGDWWRTVMDFFWAAPKVQLRFEIMDSEATPLEEGEAAQRLLSMCPQDSGNAVHHCMVHSMHIKWLDHLITFILSCFYEIHIVFLWKKFLFILYKSLPAYFRYVSYRVHRNVVGDWSFWKSSNL